MFHMSSTRQAPLAGVITVTEPIRSLGTVTDTRGVRWDIRAIYGDGIVCACREDALHPYYTNTGGDCYYGMVSQTWSPWRVVVTTPGEGE